MRLFIAIELPEEIKAELKEIQAKIDKNLAKLRIVDPEKIHLTLKFLGEVEDSKIEKIKEKLKEIEFEPFELKIKDIGVFPSEKYIRVVWVGLEPEDKVAGLQQKIDNSLLQMFKKEKDFKAHLTLARVKFVKEKEKFAESLKKIKVEEKFFKVNSFKLIKSTLTPEGPVYEDLEEFKAKVYK